MILGTILKVDERKPLKIDQRTRKLMMMQNALHHSDDVDRPHVSRKKKEKWLARIQDSIDISKRLDDNIKNRGGRLINETGNNTNNASINKTKISRKQKWEEKQLYLHFKPKTNETSHKKAWPWPGKENLKMETESLQIAAQKSPERLCQSKNR